MAKEKQTIEWKTSWRDEYLKWICGFANAEGGTLFIGMDDDGKVVGLPDARKLLMDLPNKVRDMLGIIVGVNLHEKAGKEYLEIKVEPYPYPVSYKGQYHLRSGSTKQELKGATLDRFLLAKQGRHWDSVPVPGVAVKNLSRAALESFRTRARRSKRLPVDVIREKPDGLLDKLHLTDGPHLKRAALVLFGADPERYFTGAFVKIGFFQRNSELLYQDEVHGDLFTQTDKTMDILLTKYLKAGIMYEGVQRVETYPVPEEALREAVLNALVHKDYGSGTPVQISVYPDKIMLWNPGILPHDWTVRKLTGKHPSKPFNPDVANVFFRAGMIEAWGQGIERMVRACTAAGIHKPKLTYADSGLWVEFRYAQKAPVKAPVETPVKTPVKTPDLIYAYLAENPTATLAETAVAVEKSLRAVERACARLVKDGKLKFTGPKKNGRWEVI